MPVDLSKSKNLAAAAAVTDCIVTPAAAAKYLAADVVDTGHALSDLTARGYLRRINQPNSRKIAYQPTIKSAAFVNAHQPGTQPKSLRAGMHDDAVTRGLLRGWARFIHAPNHYFYPVSEQDNRILPTNHIASKGYCRCLVGTDRSTGICQIFVPILPDETPTRALQSAILRWYPALQAGGFGINFVTPRDHADTLKTALDSFAGGQQTTPPAAVELADLEAKIAADRTGMLAITNASRRAQLRAAAAESTPTATPAASDYPWLGSVLGADI